MFDYQRINISNHPNSGWFWNPWWLWSPQTWDMRLQSEFHACKLEWALILRALGFQNLTSPNHQLPERRKRHRRWFRNERTSHTHTHTAEGVRKNVVRPRYLKQPQNSNSWSQQLCRYTSGRLPMHHQRMWTSSLAVIPQTLSLPPAYDEWTKT